MNYSSRKLFYNIFRNVIVFLENIQNLHNLQI